jgi:hypothetical protein
VCHKNGAWGSSGGGVKGNFGVGESSGEALVFSKWGEAKQNFSKLVVGKDVRVEVYSCRWEAQLAGGCGA